MRLLRVLGLGWGLVAALGVLAGRHALTRYVDSVRTMATPASAAPPVAEAAPTRAVVGVRAVLGGIGVAVLLVGAWKVLHAVLPASYGWLALWLGGAVVLHDGVLAPVLSLLRAGTGRGLRRLPAAAVALLRSGFVVGGLLVLVVVPEIWAQHLGPANPTVLPGAYARRLVVTLGVVAALTAAGMALVLLRSRSRRASPATH